MAQAREPLYDLHTHVLPDLDDGATDLDASLAMLRLSAERGVTHVVATPHSQSVDERGGIATFNERLDRTRALLDEHSIPLELLPGMEVHLMPDVPERLASGDYLTLAGTRTVLIEFDYVQWANYTDDVLFQIALQGLHPLLAHVERIDYLVEHPEVALELVERGYHTQITAMSLLGGFGQPAPRAAAYLLQRTAVHVIASDTHQPAGNRQPWPADTAARLIRLVGEEAAHTLIHVNPARVVDGQLPLTAEARPARRWWRLRRR